MSPHVRDNLIQNEISVLVGVGCGVLGLAPADHSNGNNGIHGEGEFASRSLRLLSWDTIRAEGVRFLPADGVDYDEQEGQRALGENPPVRARVITADPKMD
jgi:hypothetical protein